MAIGFLWCPDCVCELLPLVTVLFLTPLLGPNGCLICAPMLCQATPLVSQFSPPEPYVIFLNRTHEPPLFYQHGDGRHVFIPPLSPFANSRQPAELFDPQTHPSMVQPLYRTQEVAYHSPSSNKPSHTLSTQKPVTPSVTEAIFEYLLPIYRSHERPDEAQLTTTVVNVFVQVLAVTSINVIQMEYTVDMYLRQRWTDPRLAWDHIPHLKHHRDSMLWSEHKNSLWIPDLFFRNGKDGFNHDMSVPNYLIRIAPNGTVLYSQKITMILSCSMFLKLFPMDRQKCTMNIGSYGFTVDELKFMWDEQNPVIISENLQLLEFESPKGATTKDCTTNNTTSTGTYSCLLLTITLQRLVGSYLVTTYIPEVLIVMVSWLGFWIDVRAVPARITLGLLTLLGLLTEGSSVSSKLPRVTYVKAIDVWLITCLLFVIAALAEFAIAYLMSPHESVSDWEVEVRYTIQDVLRNTLEEHNHCCCCYTKCTSHKPLFIRPQRTKRRGHGHGAKLSAKDAVTMEIKPNMATASLAAAPTTTWPVTMEPPTVSEGPVDKYTSLDNGTGANSNAWINSPSEDCGTARRLVKSLSNSANSIRPSSMVGVSNKCALCEALQPECCQCPMCAELRCPKAPKHADCLINARSTSSLRIPHPKKKHIIIREPPQTESYYEMQNREQRLINEPVSTLRPRKSALKVKGAARNDTKVIMNMTASVKSEVEICKKTQSSSRYKKRLKFCTPLLRLLRNANCPLQLSRISPFRERKTPVCSRISPNTATTSNTDATNATTDTYDSLVDAYSRFLFPASFVFFNCCYWFFYLIIADKLYQAE